MSVTYKDAGVDIDAATTAKQRIKLLAKQTFTPNVLSEIGGFGGMFRASFPELSDPVLVASTDGVGTKLKIAFLTSVHNTVGYDLVSHCVNDILVQGARPLFFLDYIATGELEGEVIAQIVEGLVRACRENDCALLGGETAMMPGFYARGEYDVAGTIVGVVDRKKVVDGSRIVPGDVVLALPSLGLHTNGFSLARKLLLETAGHGVDEHIPALGCTVAEELLKPHRSYLAALQPLIERGLLKGLAHITGGGLPENIPRILPDGCSVEIRKGTWPVLPVFDYLQQIGSVPEPEMYRTFNMGIGMVLVVDAANFLSVGNLLGEAGEKVFEIGRVVSGDRQVIWQ